MTVVPRSTGLRRIQPSATIAITQLGRDLRSKGQDIISLSIGQPDFDTPDHVKETAAEAMAQGETKYPPVGGLPELRLAVSKKFQRENGLDYGQDETIVCAGGKQVISNALHATLSPGDEVIIPSPYWVSYPQLTRLFGAIPVFVATDERHQFKMQPEDLEASITPRSRWLILNSPCNPTGAVYTADELRGLADVLAKHPHVLVLSDDIYEHLVYGDTDFATIAQVAPDLHDRTLTMNGVSKAYSMTGWRIGYAGGPKLLIKSMELLQSQVTGGASSISQWAAVAALDGPQELLAQRRAVFDRRRDLLLGALSSIEGIECAKPEGAFYAFPSCAAFLGRRTATGRSIESDEDFVMALLEEKGVATVPGSAFGASQNFRMSYAVAEDELIDACQRIAGFCTEFGTDNRIE